MQTLLNKAFDGLAIAALRELMETLGKENQHESAAVVAGIIAQFTTRFHALVPFAEIGQRASAGPIVFYSTDDPIFDQLGAVAKLYHIDPDLDHVNDLYPRLLRKDRYVAAEWLEYACARVWQFHRAIGRLAGAWGSWVSPVEYMASDHAAIVNAYNVLNHIGGE